MQAPVRKTNCWTNFWRYPQELTPQKKTQDHIQWLTAPLKRPNVPDSNAASGKPFRGRTFRELGGSASQDMQLVRMGSDNCPNVLNQMRSSSNSALSPNVLNQMRSSSNSPLSPNVLNQMRSSSNSALSRNVLNQMRSSSNSALSHNIHCAT